MSAANNPAWVQLRVEQGPEKDCCTPACVAELVILALGVQVVQDAVTKLKP